jgi:endo-1,4-beta-xylanase
MRTVVSVLFLLLIMSNVSSIVPTWLQADNNSQYTLVAATGTSTTGDLIQDNIEKYRKGDVSLRILDENGAPLAERAVTIRQLSHDFLFGCSYPEGFWPGNFQERFSSLFNYATTENHFKWGVLERIQGWINWGQIDNLLSWAQSKGIKVKGHNLVWGNLLSGSGSGVPSWIRDKSRDEIRQLLEARVRQVVGRYAGKVWAWDVVNEPVHDKWFAEHFGNDYIELSLQWARETDPKAQLAVNENNILMSTNWRRDYLAQLSQVKSLGAPLNVVGIEEHHGTTWLSPNDIYKGLDEIAKLGLDIHITEFDVDTANLPIKGTYRQGVWNEQTQAEYYEMFYRTAFSYPNVKAISTWSFMDPGWRKTNCGLVRPDLSPKPVYETLDRLINEEWRTNLETKSDSGGAVSFRGFYGTYEVTMTVNGENRTATFPLNENGPRQLDLTLAKSQTPSTTGLGLNISILQNYLVAVGATSLVIIGLLLIRKRARRMRGVPRTAAVCHHYAIRG